MRSVVRTPVAPRTICYRGTGHGGQRQEPTVISVAGVEDPWPHFGLREPANLRVPDCAARQGSDPDSHLSPGDRVGLCSVAQAGGERRAGCVWPGPRRSLHSRPTEVDGRFQPRVGAPFRRASPSSGVRAGQTRFSARTCRGPRPPGVLFRSWGWGAPVKAELPPQPPESINQIVRRGGARGGGPGPGGGASCWPHPPRDYALLRRDSAAPRSAPAAWVAGGAGAGAGVWAVRLECGLRGTGVMRHRAEAGPLSFCGA